jgi:hypothetical protein
MDYWSLICRELRHHETNPRQGVYLVVMHTVREPKKFRNQRTSERCVAREIHFSLLHASLDGSSTRFFIAPPSLKIFEVRLKQAALTHALF